MICRNCLASTLTFPCPYCRAQHHVTGQSIAERRYGMATAVEQQLHPRFRSQIAGQSMAQSDAQVAAQGNTGQVKMTGWDDLELTNPLFWIPWVTNKLVGAAVDSYFSNEATAKARRDDLAAVAKQLNTVIESCAKVPQADRTGWQNWTSTFVPWYNADYSASDFDDKADQAQAATFQTQLRSWQIEISKYCDIGMPLLPAPNPTLGQLADKTLDTAQSYFSTVKTVTVVTAIGVVALLIFSPRARAAALAAI